MTVARVEVLVEDPSTEEAMKALLPRMLKGIPFSIHAFSCKHELLKRLPNRFAGYARWMSRDWRILVVVDRDDDDCNKLKQRLEQMAAESGLATKSNPKRGQFVVVNRVAIEELEAWFFGDWDAVRRAYPKVDANLPSQAKYRHPDRIAGGTWEAFERVLKASGYFKTGLRKIEVARAVAEHMDPGRNRSPSFRALRDALMQLGTA
jgi:hypothetical protein